MLQRPHGPLKLHDDWPPAVAVTSDWLCCDVPAEAGPTATNAINIEARRRRIRSLPSSRIPTRLMVKASATTRPPTPEAPLVFVESQIHHWHNVSRLPALSLLWLRSATGIPELAMWKPLFAAAGLVAALASQAHAGFIGKTMTPTYPIPFRLGRSLHSPLPRAWKR